MPQAQQLRFGFVPYNTAANEYCARMVAILERKGSVSAFSPRRPTLRALLAPQRVDAAFVSWYENRMLDANGAVSALAVGKVLLRTLALRAFARKLIFIKHNRFPHATRAKDQPLAERLVELYERWLFDGSMTHSPAAATGERLYCPHPLYLVEETPASPPERLAAFSTGTFHVVFGRIEPYKQLEQLIDAFPRDKRLVICGRCNEPDYLAALVRRAPENVTVVSGFLPDAEAQWLIRRSSGVVISHASEDMIVSASFFYAMSLGKRVYAVETAFLRWANSVLGDELISVDPDLETLCQRLTTAANGGSTSRELETAIQRHFGDDVVASQIDKLLEHIALDVRAKESSSRENSTAVCCSQRDEGALRS